MFFILTLGGPLVNRIDLLALTLAGPTQHKPVLDPLAVQHLENRLNMSQDFSNRKFELWKNARLKPSSESKFLLDSITTAYVVITAPVCSDLKLSDLWLNSSDFFYKI